MIVWPAGLPQFVDRDGYEEGTGDGRIRSQTDTGTVKVRRRFSAVPRPLTVTLTLTGDQMATFESFVANDLGGGVLPFQMPNLRGGARIVQMAEVMPKWTPIGIRWRLSLDLVILP